MIIISILIINWGCFSSRLHYCPRLGLLVHALGSPEQECNDVEGATYIKIIILIINVTIIITIIVYTRVAQEYQYTPNLRHLV